MKLWLQLWICPYHLTWLTKFRLAVCTSKWNMARLQPENCWSACVLRGTAVICADYHILAILRVQGSVHIRHFGATWTWPPCFGGERAQLQRCMLCCSSLLQDRGAVLVFHPYHAFLGDSWGSQESYLPAKDEEQQGAQPTQMCWDSSRRNNSQHCKWQ